LANCLTTLVVEGIRYFEVGEDERRAIIGRVASVLRGLGISLGIIFGSFVELDHFRDIDVAVYGRGIGQWIQKAYESAQAGATIVMLIPSRTDTRWWHDYVMKASEIRFIRGRLKFGDAKGNAPFPSAVVVFRPTQAAK